MRSVVLLGAAMAVVACKPPPAVTLADTAAEADFPSIEIVYPKSGEMALGSDCALTISVAVDIDNFQLVTPNIAGETDQDVEGQGHWHLSFFDGQYEVVDETLATKELTDLAVGTLVVVTGTLQSNTHADIDSPEFEDRVEVTVANNIGETCP